MFTENAYKDYPRTYMPFTTRMTYLETIAIFYYNNTDKLRPCYANRKKNLQNSKWFKRYRIQYADHAPQNGHKPLSRWAAKTGLGVLLKQMDRHQNHGEGKKVSMVLGYYRSWRVNVIKMLQKHEILKDLIKTFYFLK